MRLSNVVIGVLLAIVLAYVHDVSVASPSPDGHPQTIVNWEVLGRIASDAADWLRTRLDDLLALVQKGR